MKDVFILDAIRTPIGNFGGTLSSIRADDLAERTKDSFDDGMP